MARRKPKAKPPTIRTRSGQLEEVHSYTDQDVVKVLALYNLYRNLSQVSRETGVPVSTIHSWVQKKDEFATKIHSYDQRMQDTQDQLMEAMGFVGQEALQQIHKKLPDASAAQAATIYGILFDKQQILSGSSNQAQLNFSFDLTGLSADDTASLMQRVLDRQRQAKALPVEAKQIEDTSAGPEEMKESKTETTE